jgi:hypothetical protein
LLGQVKSMNIPDRKTNNKNWDYTQFEKQISANFDIKLLSSDISFDEFYRLSNSRQIIEVWKIDTIYGGQIINFTRTYVDHEDRERIKSKLIYDKVGFPADTSKIIFDKFKSLDSIPDMDKINGWTDGFDGETYSIESSTKKEYSLKSYWSPTAQEDSILYKNEIISFVDYIYKELNLYRHYKIFTSNLPNGSYVVGFAKMTIVGRKKTKKRK